MVPQAKIAENQNFMTPLLELARLYPLSPVQNNSWNGASLFLLSLSVSSLRVAGKSFDNIKRRKRG